MSIDISRVTDRLWIGAASDAFDGSAARADTNFVRDQGITLVIDCRADSDDSVLWAGVHGVRYVNHGVHDSGDPLPATFFTHGVETYVRHVSAKHGAVLVQCEAGSNRSPALAMAILMTEGASPTDARSLLTAVRPDVGHRYAHDAGKWFADFSD